MARKKENNNLLLGVGVFLLAVGSLVVLFGPQSTGQVYKDWTNTGETYQQGIQAQYEQYQALGDTVAQICLRNVKEKVTSCCAWEDIPNSDESCISLCKPFGWDMTTCFERCEWQCKRHVSNVQGYGAATLGR